MISPYRTLTVTRERDPMPRIHLKTAPGPHAGPRTIVASAALLLLAACASLNVETQAAPEASFRDLETYAWLPNPPADLTVQFPRIGRIVRESVDAEMQLLGYAEDPFGRPDFWVNTHVVDGRTDVRTTWAFYGPRYDWISVLVGPRIDVYNEGTLIVDLLEGESRDLIWRGVATAMVQGGGRAQQDAERKVRKAVEEMLSKLP
jgi:hypothetical protein